MIEKRLRWLRFAGRIMILLSFYFWKKLAVFSFQSLSKQKYPLTLFDSRRKFRRINDSSNAISVPPPPNHTNFPSRLHIQTSSSHSCLQKKSSGPISLPTQKQKPLNFPFQIETVVRKKVFPYLPKASDFQPPLPSITFMWCLFSCCSSPEWMKIFFSFVSPFMIGVETHCGSRW